MSLNNFLSHLHKVRKTGKSSWTACCPSHNDKSPSLAVTEKDDGVILVKCFGGCSSEEIMASVGMDIGDLFPASQSAGKPHSRPFPAADVLRLIGKESLIVAATAAQLRTRTLTTEEIDRAIRAAESIQRGLTAAGIDLKGMWE